MQNLPSNLPSLQADCSQCAALCCVAYPFTKDEDFGLIKAADTPCPNLSATCFNCTIHSDLPARGFGGCVAYSCAGAGQRVTQELFQGEDWREDPDLLDYMTHALRVLRPIHEALLILQDALKLPLTQDQHTQCVALVHALCPAEDQSIWDFEDPEVQEALASLPDFVAALSA